ncbi:MAG: bifunctional folylpolyglutamate synthase/dihydrofolate synthase [Deltaproteobacteria bacterium]|jgi:dihydrofolate synthase/folylpolyglutamate synthase|nr:bifunctional folylpolyglutamate synthase/dihydrofolate synthase [Deltaproteobacteria bacterium]
MSYRQTLSRLFDLQKFGIKVGLESMRRLLAALGNPEAGLRLAHIAGTNGKGSTAAFLAAIAQAAGYRVGLYTSPHLVTFRERIQLNGIMITEAETLDLFQRVWAVIDESQPPTFFEFVTAMAFLYFQAQAPDLAIIETGLGGRLDSTNVINPLITAITNISLEHTEYLGTTLTAIATEKAGIIKKGAPLVGGRLEGEPLRVIKARLAAVGAPGKLLGEAYQVTRQAIGQGGVRPAGPVFHYQGPQWNLSDLAPRLAGPYQVENAGQAVALAESLTQLGFDLQPAAVQAGLQKARWPGRAERLNPGDWPPDHSGRAPLVLDGAHNPGGAQAFGAFLAQAAAERVHLIVGVMADKDVSGVLSPLIPLASRLYLTRPEYARAATPEELRDRLIAALGPLPVPAELCPNLPAALQAAAAAAGPRDLVVVSGSLFTVGETLAYLNGEPVVESN